MVCKGLTKETAIEGLQDTTTLTLRWPICPRQSGA